MDFNEIKARHPIEDVIAQHVTLKRQGRELMGLCPFHQESTPSFSVVPHKGFYYCHGCGAHGDVVNFVREYFDLPSPQKAVEILDGKPAPPMPARIPTAAEADTWHPYPCAPDDAPALDLGAVYNPRRGRTVDYRRCVAMWRYDTADGRIAAYVVRLEIDGKKLTPTISWALNSDTGQSRWAVVRSPRPHPLYNLRELLARPSAEVIVVEGEKAADAAKLLYPSRVVITWLGGTNSVDNTDWSPLAGRSVLLWPDADPPGLHAMYQVQQLCGADSVRYVDTEGLAKGFDAADLRDPPVPWVKERVRSGPMPEPAPIKKPKRERPARESVVTATVIDDGPDLPTDPAHPLNQGYELEHMPRGDESPEYELHDVETPDGRTITVPSLPGGKQKKAVSALVTLWRELGLSLSGSGIPLNNLDNAAMLLQMHDDVSGRIWQDEQSGRVYTDWQGPEREWTDNDDRLLTMWVQRQCGLAQMSVSTVSDAVNLVANLNRRNQLVEWLRSLEWDGGRRLDHWTRLALGVPGDDYHQAVSRNWILSMVARALKPGCKVDTMPILYSAKQGLHKSTVLRALVGDRYFTESQDKIGSKDFYLLVHSGAWLIEISELASFSGAQADAHKSVISCQSDRIRPPYGRRPVDMARRCIFAGTTNRKDHLTDPTGNRRFWPMTIEHIDLDWLRENREQLFAEAVEKIEGGACWWDMPESTEAVVDDYRETDAWEDVINTWTQGRKLVLTQDVLMECLRIDIAHQTRVDAQRVGDCMRALGWTQKVHRFGRVVTRVWEK